MRLGAAPSPVATPLCLLSCRPSASSLETLLAARPWTQSFALSAPHGLAMQPARPVAQTGWHLKCSLR